MNYFKKANNFGIWHPDYVASDVLDIDYNKLSQIGIKAIAFDVDGTLTVNGSNLISDDRANRLIFLLDKANIKPRFLASNSIRDLNSIAGSLKGFSVHQPHSHSGKPSKEFYVQLLKKANVSPNNMAMVGDRALQDIWAAKRMGLTTILVELNPKYCTLKDKIFLRHIWQKYLVRLKK